MSKETLEWLNDNVMFGFAAHRSTWGAGTSFGNGQMPWFADDNYQFLYQDAIPVEDVIGNLFYWEPIEAEPCIRVACDIAEADSFTDDGTPFRYVADTKRKAIMRPDTLEVFNYFGRDSYRIHSYQEWLIKNVANLLDDGEVGISSAGLLRGGGQAWVTIELPESIEVAGAGHVRPCILAATSCDGTLATTYATRILRVECDNSLRISLQGDGNTMRVKHSTRSMGRISDARSALGLIYQMGEQAQQWFDALADVDVTDSQFAQIVRHLAPIPTPDVVDGKVRNQRAITIANTKQNELDLMWSFDDRAAPWQGTLAGAYHAVSTWQQHTIPNDDVQVRRQMVGAMSGSFDKAEQDFWNVVSEMGLHIPVLS